MNMLSIKRTCAILTLTLAPQIAWAKPAAAPADEAFRGQQPRATPIRPLAQPTPVDFTLAGGMRVLLVERHQLPTVTMELVLPGGTRDDPPGKEGLGAVCMSLLTDGTQKLDKIAYNEALADIAASLSSHASVDSQGISLATLLRHVDPALDLLAETILQPGMRKDEFQRVIQQRQAALQASRGNAAAVAGRLAGSVVYGPQHPFGRFATEASYAKLTVEDCRQYAAEHVRPDGARLYVVGAIDRPTLEAKLGARLAKWQGKAPGLQANGTPVPTGVAKPRPGKVFLVDVPGARQAVVQVMHPGPARTAPDFAATTVLASVLSSGFSSRINMNIREKHGYAYGAGGGFSYTRDAGIFNVQASVRSDVTGASIREILSEMKIIRGADATADELTREKQGAVLALPARWATGGSILSTFRGLEYHGLPLDEYVRFVPQVLAVDAAQVLAAAKAHVQPQDAQVLVVGDAASVAPQLAELKKEGVLVGEIVRLDLDGQPLR